jgi:hypothetical protein
MFDRKKLSRFLVEEGLKTATLYSPDEDFYEHVLDVANEVAWLANKIDGPKGREAKKMYTDRLKDRVRAEKANGVDPRRMRKIINDTWKAVYR